MSGRSSCNGIPVALDTAGTRSAGIGLPSLTHFHTDGCETPIARASADWLPSFAIAFSSPMSMAPEYSHWHFAVNAHGY